MPVGLLSHNMFNFEAITSMRWFISCSSARANPGVEVAVASSSISSASHAVRVVGLSRGLLAGVLRCLQISICSLCRPPPPASFSLYRLRTRHREASSWPLQTSRPGRSAFISSRTLCALFLRLTTVSNSSAFSTTALEVTSSRHAANKQLSDGPGSEEQKFLVALDALDQWEQLRHASPSAWRETLPTAIGLPMLVSLIAFLRVCAHVRA